MAEQQEANSLTDTEAPDPKDPVIAEAPEGAESESAPDEKDHADPAEEAERRNRRLERRINRATARAYQAEARAKALEEQLRGSQAAPTAAQGGALDPRNFDDYAEYLKAVAREEAREALKSERESSTKAAKAQKAQEVISKGEEEFEDFEDVALSPRTRVTESMADIISESKIAHKVLYHLGKHRDLAEDIAEMSPAAQARALVRLEAELESKPGKSSAPPPIRALSGSGKAASAGPSDSDSLEDWMRKERARMKAKGINRYG